MTGVELTRRVPCATCDGTGIDWARPVEIDRVRRDTGTRHEFRSHKCPDCTDGTVRVAVSCAGCAFCGDECFCEQYGHFKQPNWGCLSWTAKEGTDGR